VGPVFLSSVRPVSPFRSPDKRSDIRERWCGFAAVSRVSLRSPGLRTKMKDAERRQTQGNHRRILRCGARPFGARTLAGVPPRLSPKGIIPSQRLSFRPGFLGRGLHGRYPPSPVPVQGSTSHPGHNAGRHDAQAAREQPAKPPAGTALAPMTRCASAPCPSTERGLRSNCIRDHCQLKSDIQVTMTSQGFFWSLVRVMAGLVPAIHVLLSRIKDVDARNRCGHDELNECVV
jgi:hypothetical protein